LPLSRNHNSLRLMKDSCALVFRSLRALNLNLKIVICTADIYFTVLFS